MNPILQKNLLYNDILGVFDPEDTTETLLVKQLTLGHASYKYLQLTGLPLNKNFQAQYSFDIEVTRNSDSQIFTETSNNSSIGATQFWVNYHDPYYQNNGRIYLNSSISVGTSFTVRYPLIGTVSSYENIFEFTKKQLSELELTSSNLDAGSLLIKNLGSGVASTDAINKGQMDSADSTLQGQIDDIVAIINPTDGFYLSNYSNNYTATGSYSIGKYGFYSISAPDILSPGGNLTINITGHSSSNSRIFFLRVDFAAPLGNRTIQVNGNNIVYAASLGSAINKTYIVYYNGGWTAKEIV